MRDPASLRVLILRRFVFSQEDFQKSQEGVSEFSREGFFRHGPEASLYYQQCHETAVEINLINQHERLFKYVYLSTVMFVTVNAEMKTACAVVAALQCL